MKKLLLILVTLLALPTMASAATVQVVPTLTNSHGGTATGADLRVCVVQNGIKTCDTDMPTFSIAEGPYEVQVFPPAGYSYETNYHCKNGTKFDYSTQKEVCSNGEVDRTNTCSGIIGADEDKVCYVSYIDGAKGSNTVAPVGGTTGGVTSNTSAQPSTKSGLTAPQVAAIINLLEAFGVDAKTVGVVAVILYGN
jgi:hypothetical protein